MSEGTQVLLGLIVGGTIGLIIATVIIVVVIKMKWHEKFYDWLDL